MSCLQAEYCLGSRGRGFKQKLSEVANGHDKVHTTFRGCLHAVQTVNDVKTNLYLDTNLQLCILSRYISNPGTNIIDSPYCICPV